MDLNSLIPGIESFIMEDVEITNNVTTGEKEETEAPAADDQAKPEEATEEPAESAEAEQPAEMKSSYFNW